MSSQEVAWFGDLNRPHFYGYYYAAGIRGQRIYVMEKQDLVVVTTANLPEDSQTETKMRKIAQYAISACK